MIIKRKRNSNFTVVSNRMLNDDRLSFEGLGLLSYLMGRPDNWTVRIEQIRKRGGIGKDKARRLVNELLTAGYIVKSIVRDPVSKQFSSPEYTVYDEPETENPAPALQGPENKEHNKDCKVIRTESNKNTPSEKGDSISDVPSSKPKKTITYTMEFEAFWKAYPKTSNMSKSEAFKEWKKLDEADHHSATASLEKYKAHLESNEWLKAVYAERYLKQRRFDGFNESQNEIDWEKLCKVSVELEQWSPQFGPAPGSPGCRVPEEFVTSELISAFNRHGETV